MKEKELIENILSEFPREMKVYFKTKESKILIPLGRNLHEVDNTLIFFRKSDEDEVATIKYLLENTRDNSYTNAKEEDSKNFRIAICNSHKWNKDDSCPDSLLTITDAVKLDDIVVLTTETYPSKSKQMRNNALIIQLLEEFQGKLEVYFKTPRSNTLIPIEAEDYNKDDILVFSKKSNDNKKVATVDYILDAIYNHPYTLGCPIHDYFEVAICNFSECKDDYSDSNSLLAITGASKIGNKVILTTEPFDYNTEEHIWRLKAISNDESVLSEFTRKIEELKSLPQFKDIIFI